MKKLVTIVMVVFLTGCATSKDVNGNEYKRLKCNNVYLKGELKKQIAENERLRVFNKVLQGLLDRD